jgi:hypothetical protein
MSILPLVIIVGTLLAMGFTVTILGKVAADYGKRKGE